VAAVIGVAGQQRQDRGRLGIDHLLQRGRNLAPARRFLERRADEQAPSRTSATVICTAYLCTSTSSWPRISAHTTVSCAKFFGTPPPIISRPVVPALILISVSSRKVGDAVERQPVAAAFIASTWCLTRPKPAELSVNAGQKIGTSCS
jgi:hypothetical protein